MKKRVHTIFCWILALSLVWLPLSVSADFSLPPTEKNGCHEMDSAMSGHKMSGHKMDSAMSGHKMSGHKMDSVMNDQAAVSDRAMHESMMQKGCCDNCDNCTACIGMTSCGQNSNHFSAFIIFHKDILQSQTLSQTSTEHIVQYHSQIISPDFRPPIV